MINEYGEVGGMRIGKANRSTRRNPAPVPLFVPKMPHDLTWDLTRADTVVSRRPTAPVMARPSTIIKCDGRKRTEDFVAYFKVGTWYLLNVVGKIREMESDPWTGYETDFYLY
jgi:hypothetical protein